MMTSSEHHYDVIGDSLPDIPLTVISFGTDDNIYLVICRYSKTFCYIHVPLLFSHWMDSVAFSVCIPW